MDIEEAINYLEENLKNWKDTRPSLSNTDIVEEVDKDYKAIEILLTAYEKEKELLELASNMLDNIDYDQIPIAIGELKSELEKEKEKNKEYNMGIKNLISQIESAINFMKTDKSKVKVDMYQQKEEDLKLEIVHLKKLLKEE